MLDRDYRDILSGLFLIIIGSAVCIHVYSNLPFGSLHRMGPGLFPGAMAAIIACLGLGVMLPAFFRKGERLYRPDVRAIISILGSILAFALLLESFGLLIALLALVVISTLADYRITLSKAVLLGLALTALIVAVFQFGFGLKVTLLSWPW